ncbi:GNAT family N-acetyltransferase, partial [Rhizobium leguminosarum]|nr:GNAT family N-acetyltransferase [Rhizobium leguminosarum]
MRSGVIVACAGLELYGSDALLRSVVVTERARHRGLGRALVGILERDAKIIGVRHLFLLSPSASDYFASLG